MTESKRLTGAKKSRSVGTNVRLGFVAVVFLLLVSAGISLYNTRQLYDKISLLTNSQDIQQALGDVLSATKDIETGQRGYVITGAIEFLDPFNSASDKIQTQLERLRLLTAANPEQNAKVTSLEKKIGVHLALSRKSNALRAEQGLQAALDFAATGQGKLAMDEIRLLVDQMMSAERESHQELELQCNRSYFIAMFAHLFIVSLGVGLVGLAFELVRREIAAHHRTMDAQREQREWLRVTLTSIGDAVIVTNGEGVITFLNPVAGTLTGWNQDAVGRKLSEVFHIIDEATRQPSENPAARVLREGTVVGLAGQTLLVARDGKEIAIDDSAAPIQDPRGRIDGVVLVFRDITERRQTDDNLRAATAQLRERVEQLRDADRRKNEFLAMLAHELRNPLAPVQNAVHLLRKNCPTDPETQWAHDVIERQVQHMTRMVDDLLDVSRITRGMINLRKERIDIASAVNRAIEMTQPLIDSRKHRLTVSLPDKPLQLDADPPRLAQVLANLLNNAAKYTEESGQIWLTVERQEGDAVISVRDTGVGIPPEYLPHVFDLFSQEDSSLERTHGGLGIGLTLVRILVKMHGGAIQAFSAGSGKGSEFVMRLPALDVADLPQIVAPTVENSATVSPRRILVVDDNVDGAKSLARLLTQFGHDVQTAHDGHAALEIARKTHFDVVLLDIGMPHMSGLEVARRLRGELGLTNAWLVAMTGYGQDEDRHRSQEAGFNAHMIKPVDLDELQAILGRCPASLATDDSSS